MQTENIHTWTDLKARISKLKTQSKRSAETSGGANESAPIFRGQGSEKWRLETSYDRTRPSHRWLADYYRQVAAAKTVVDSLSPGKLTPIDLVEADKQLENNVLLPVPLPHYDLLVHLRHHAFPSPLLDWSKSFYVASYFAFAHPRSDYIALYAYQEFIGNPKSHGQNEPHLVTFGPYVHTHPRHVLQQALYTVAVQRESDQWKIASHEEVFAEGSKSQDRLTKFVVPVDQAREAIEELDEMNITAYSLFQTDDSLFETLGRRLFSDA